MHVERLYILRVVYKKHRLFIAFSVKALMLGLGSQPQNTGYSNSLSMLLSISMPSVYSITPEIRSTIAVRRSISSLSKIRLKTYLLRDRFSGHESITYLTISSASFISSLKSAARFPAQSSRTQLHGARYSNSRRETSARTYRFSRTRGAKVSASS